MMLRYSLLVRGLCAVIAAGLGTTLPAAAAPQGKASSREVAELRAALIVETRELGKGGPSMKDVLEGLEDEVLRDRGVGPAVHDGDPRIVVVVRPLSEDAGSFDMRVELRIEQDGEVWDDASWGFDCPRCSDGYLLSKVGVALHDAVTRLEQEVERAGVGVDEPGENEGEGEGGEAVPEETPKGETPSEETPKPGPLVWAGGAVAIVGAVGVGVGLALGLREDGIEGDLGSDRRLGRQTRTPGWVTAGVGVAGLLTGGVLLTVGLVRWVREKDAAGSAAAKRVSVSPLVGRGGAGLGVFGRF